MAKPQTAASIVHHLLIVAVLAPALPISAAQWQTPEVPLATAAQVPYPHATAPSPALDCFTYLLNLSDCLTFVEGGSNLTRPDPGCCPELANLVETQPICLCQLLGNPGGVGVSVDVSRALKLPSVCNVTTPPVSLCAAIGAPVSLTPSEAPSHATSPSPNTSVGDGENGGPSNLGCSLPYPYLIELAALFITYIFLI